jgi:DNA-binding transcriptional MerR regulator
VSADEPADGLPDKMFFRIGEVAELVGVEPHVLRYWEQEFRVRPQRSTAGQRMFRRRDLAKFMRIKKLLHEEGYTIAGARKAMEVTVSEPPAAATPDDARVREAIDRIEALREKVRAARERFSRPLASGTPS